MDLHTNWRFNIWWLVAVVVVAQISGLVVGREDFARERKATI
jgi:cyanate permease